MGRRRLLRVVSSSDEEDDDSQQRRNQDQLQPPHQEVSSVPQPGDEEVEVQFQEPLPNIEAVALNSSSVPIQPQLISDEDEDFIEVSDHFTPSPPHQPMETENSSRESAVPDSPVGRVLRSLGLNLRTEWLESCIRGLETAVPGFSGFDSETKAKFCFQHFLSSDMNLAAGGLLPPNVDSMHLVELGGPFVLQVDEVVNISCSLRQRYQNVPAGPKRCLKLSMTDGIQRVFGMEYRPIKELQALAMAGFKVAIKNVIVRRGLLMLVPETLEVLGGFVQELEAARQRLVFEVNKPPRGKRTRQGVLPPLAARATLAAWPQNGPNDPVENNASVQNNDNSIPQDVQAAGSAPSGASTNTLRTTGNPAVVPANRDADTAPSGAGISIPRETEDSVFLAASRNADSSPLAAGGIYTPRTAGDYADVPASRDADELPIDIDTTDHPCTRESTVFSTNRMTAEDNLGSATVQDVDMADPSDHLFLLSGDRELPFTYLTSLLAKWDCIKGFTSHVQGKVKCFLTAVKGFQYRERSTYELNVYVEDGSFISEVLLHHNVVQKFIGHPPEEVSAALSSLDKNRISNMKKKLSKLQDFLVNFEGVMRVELNNSSELPIVIEMIQGCPASDAWSLLKRCLSLDNPSAHNHSDPIVLSP